MSLQHALIINQVRPNLTICSIIYFNSLCWFRGRIPRCSFALSKNELVKIYFQFLSTQWTVNRFVRAAAFLMPTHREQLSIQRVFCCAWRVQSVRFNRYRVKVLSFELCEVSQVLLQKASGGSWVTDRFLHQKLAVPDTERAANETIPSLYEDCKAPAYSRSIIKVC